MPAASKKTLCEAALRITVLTNAERLSTITRRNKNIDKG